MYKILQINKISLRRLIEGGAPIFITQNKNQKKLREGKIIINPLVKYRLREEITSYVILAKQNMPDDTKPWEIIITKEPKNPR